MIVVSVIFLLLSAFVCVGNISGWIAAWRRHRRGERGGYSDIAFFSLLFAGIAWLTGRSVFGCWAFLPAALDPGTFQTLYFLVMFPWILRK